MTGSSSVMNGGVNVQARLCCVPVAAARQSPGQRLISTTSYPSTGEMTHEDSIRAMSARCCMVITRGEHEGNCPRGGMSKVSGVSAYKPFGQARIHTRKMDMGGAWTDAS